MARKKPPSRVVVSRSRNNPHRKLIAAVPTLSQRLALSGQVSYGPSAKHKFHPVAYGLAPYQGQDVERTYCDEHANFDQSQWGQIPLLLARAVKLGLWSEQDNKGAPSLLWTLSDTGWIYELRITNAGQFQYHGYPILPDDAFARHVLVRARAVLNAEMGLANFHDAGLASAIAAAEAFYR
ncbi:hypothetical protein [Herbaspirillum rubrisubalbicans]|uniref:hypothetical protein n=1 Tax=Herbaspirillum rubrisubalbicans TaxID=80842 RepID=UPI000ACC4FFC|nr:hypothetical protein [Herbaspirillum rubrisubalbicans]